MCVLFPQQYPLCPLRLHRRLPVRAYRAGGAGLYRRRSPTAGLYASGLANPQPQGRRPRRTFATPEGEACRQSLRQLSQLLWQNGVSQPPISFEAAFTRAQRAAHAANWRWVIGALAELREGVDACQQRASHYVPEQLLAQLAGLNARLESADRMAQLADAGQTPPLPWRTVVGQGIAGEAQLDHLRLISLGMRGWQDNQQYGLRLWFSDPDTGSILHLSHRWPLAERAQNPLWQRRLFTFQAGILAGGQIITRSARRTAGGELLLGARQRLSSSLPLTEDAWLLLSAPLRQPGAAALREYLRQRPGLGAPAQSG
jgi:hypothetical protein